MSKKISAVILAAGSSSRMGANKLFLPIGDKTVIERVAFELLKSQINQIVAVGGRDFDLLVSILSKYDIEIIENKNYLMGQSTSVACGINMVDKSSEACFFIMGDQPLIDSNFLDQMIYMLEDENTIVVPMSNRKRGAPVLFGRRYFEELGNQAGDMGGRNIIKKYSDMVRIYEIENDAFFWDVDTKEDYDRVANYVKMKGML